MEVLAVIVIITIIGLIAVPSVLSIINTGKNSSYDILVKDITVAAIELHEELSFVGTNIYHYDANGNTSDVILLSKNDNFIIINLQTLVSNGFLTGTNNPDKSTNSNEKIITNPKNGEDMGSCAIKIEKKVDTDTFNISYEITSESDYVFCPTAADYNKALNIKSEGE